MTSHWPTFADGLFWCACQNKTFATEDEWLDHVVSTEMGNYIQRVYTRAIEAADALIASMSLDRPSKSSSGHAAPSR